MTMSNASRDPRVVLTDLYWAGVHAVAPSPVLRAALDRLPKGRARVWVIAIGKAAQPMASAAVDYLAAHSATPVGGIIIAPDAPAAPHQAIECVAGDHPVPGDHSFAAAARLADVAARVHADDEVWVLLSGGATSLAAGPIAGVQPKELTALYKLLLGSGLDITEMNLVRKRFSRWGAGRLAVALAPARVRNFIMSDVIGDDLASIGSGPCVPDPSTASQIRALLTGAHLWDRIAPSMRQAIEAAEHDPSLETPKPGSDAFAHVEPKIIASNRIALEAIAARATELGYEPRTMDTKLAGEAADAGRQIATLLVTQCGCDDVARAEQAAARKMCLIWGGETTVTLGAGATGRGGRCQELALVVARELARTPPACGATLLAAGTDGRDGPTDAAGAIVDCTTWDAIRRAGRDPERDLATHDSESALDPAHALLRTGLTGTNVMDVVIGICGLAECQRPA